MSLSVGIVGMPNVGKSSLFKALTRKEVDCANYPFCTIDPNVGVVRVPDERLELLAKMSNSARIIPAAIEFIDIAGLVKGAHKGEGLGNQFLSHIREADAIAHIVRVFADKDVAHVSGRVDPRSDIETINLELIFSDLAIIEKRIEAIESERKKEKEAEARLSVYKKIREGLEKGILANALGLTNEEKALVKDLNLLTLKEVLYVFNVDEEKLSEKDYTAERLLAEFGLRDILGDNECLLISAKLESELAELPEEEARDFLKEMGIKESGLDKLIRASYKRLGLATFFTTGPKETRAWTILRGMKAPQAAGRVHSDFERGFISARVIYWKDLIEAGGEAKAKERGMIRLEGRDYVVRDGDVCEFLFNI